MKPPNEKQELHEELHYQLVLTWSDADQCWIAEAPEVPECQASGQTALEVLSAMQTRLEEWVTQALVSGHPIPLPQKRPLTVERARRVEAAHAEGYTDATTSTVHHDSSSLAAWAYERAMTTLWEEPIETDDTLTLVELLAHAYQEGYREGAAEQGWMVEE